MKHISKKISILNTQIFILLFLSLFIDYFNIIKISYYINLTYLALINGILLIYNSINYKEIKEYTKYGLLVSLFLLTIIQFIEINLIYIYVNLIYVYFITFIIIEIIHYKNKKESQNIKFNYKYSIILLIGIILIATFIKLPYFGLSFTGEQSKKYNSYVEPAQYMNKYNSPFIYYKKYMAEPLTNPEGNFNGYLHLPIMEWGLFITYKIFDDTSIEYSTRMFMHLIEILILIFSYILFKQWLNKTQALLITLFIATNPIFTLSTYVTVYDSISILFMILSLIYTKKHFKEKGHKNMILTGIFFGLGNSVKYSLIAWYAPILFFIMWYKTKNKTKLFRNYTIIFSISIYIFLFTRYSLMQISISPFTSISLLIIGTIILYFLIQLTLKNLNYLDKIIKFLIKYKIRTITISILILIFGILILKLLNFSFNYFLTSPKLLFNYKLYLYLINTQIQSYLTTNLYTLSLIGLIGMSATKNNNKYFINAFLFGSIIYIILASKVIFFHQYYTLIIMLTFFIILANLIDTIINNKSLTYTILFIILILMFILPTATTSSINLISIEKQGTKEASQYLIKHTNETDIYIPQYSTNVFSITTGRGGLDRISYLENYEVKTSIKEHGFKTTMDKYNIKYLISTRSKPDYYPFVNLFTFKEISSSDLGDIREGRILAQLGYTNNAYDDSEYRKHIIEKEELHNKFELETQIGDYYFYKLKN